MIPKTKRSHDELGVCVTVTRNHILPIICAVMKGVLYKSKKVTNAWLQGKNDSEYIRKCVEGSPLLE